MDILNTRMMADMEEDVKPTEQSEELIENINTTTVTIEDTTDTTIDKYYYKSSGSTGVNSGMGEDVKPTKQSEELKVNINTAKFTIQDITDTTIDKYLNKSYVSTGLNYREAICLGSISVIFVLLICILIFFEFKDHDV